MKKEQFLKTLYRRLKWQVPKGDMEKILQAYKEYFNKGAAENEEEEALVAACGGIDLLVDEILTEYNPVAHLPLRVALTVVLWLFAFFMSLSHGLAIRMISNSPIGQSIVLLSLILLSVMFLGGSQLIKKKLPALKQISYMHGLNILIVIIALLFSYYFVHGSVMEILHLEKNASLWTTTLVTKMPVEYIGKFFASTVILLKLIFCFLSIGGCISMLKHGLATLPLLCANGTLFLYFCAYGTMVKSLSAADGYLTAFSQTNQILYLGILWVAISFIILFMVRSVQK